MLEDNVTRKKVIDYFYEKYNIVLKHPVLPALQAGSDSRPMFFPMEVILFLCLCYVNNNVLGNILLDLKSAAFLFVSALSN